MKYKLYIGLCRLQGAFCLLSGGINLIREIIKGNDIASIGVFGIMSIVGIFLLMRGRVAHMISAVIASVCIGLAGWMYVIVYWKDGDWSIYGEFGTLFNELLIIVGVYNSFIFILGYLVKDRIYEDAANQSPK